MIEVIFSPEVVAAFIGSLGLVAAAWLSNRPAKKRPHSEKVDGE